MSIVTDPLFYLLAIPAITLLGIGKGGFSGVGMIATPLMALAIPPLQAAAIVQPILMVQDVISAWVYRRDYDAWNLKVLLIGGTIGVSAAWFLARYLTDAHVRVMVGVIGVVFVLYSWLARMPAEPRKPRASAGVFWGAMTGITSTLAQAGAPPFQVFMLPQRLPKMTLVGTTIIFYAVLNWLKAAAYLSLGQFTLETVLTSLLLMPLAIATNFFGFWLVRRVPHETFYKIAYALMFLISAELIRSGVTTLLAA
jgi:uncharacterized membrane protein YfcA